MGTISIIAAIGKNNELGKDNDLLWHIKEDLNNFKSLTMNKKIVMGSNTYKSLPKKLEGREYIVLSNSLKNIDALVFNDFHNLLEYINTLDEEVMIIGGASIYQLFLPHAQKLYLTEVDDVKEADVYFPEFNKKEYKKKILKSCEDNSLKYNFVLYEKEVNKMQGKLIVIEGTDCSGKETQSKLLVEKLKEAGYNVFQFGFPNYDSPTGRIVGGPYLGKSYICDGWFEEGATNVDSLVACCYYAADRRYNVGVINEHLDKGDVVILDRYVESNMAHQGGKLTNKEDRLKLWKKLETLEFDILELPRPDAVMFLYMPYEYAEILKKARKEGADQHESSKQHLQNAEASYLELTKLYDFIKIDCVKDETIRSIDDINEEVLERVRKIIDED